MIVLSLWGDIFKQDLFYMVTGFYDQEILHHDCYKFLLLLGSQ